MALRVIWLSANQFGLEVLKTVLAIQEVEVISVFTLTGDATTIMYDGVDPKSWSGFGIPVYEVNNINDHAQDIQNLNPDLIVMCGWRQIICKVLMDIPKMGMIGFHPTLLPKGRGPAPIINTILEGYSQSGVTMYYISDGLDDGDIIGQEPFAVELTDYAGDIYRKVTLSGKKLVAKYLPLIVKGSAPRMPQDDSMSTYFPKRTLKDNEIDLQHDSLEMIHRKIRAFSKPYRGAFIRKDNQKIIIWNAEIGEYP
jgi:methionyl-tRNA formyltransferase